MLVDFDSAIAKEEATEPLPVALPGNLIELEKIQCRHATSAIPPPPNTPWSMVAIRDHGDDDNHPAIIFPPINHENLQICNEIRQVNSESLIASSAYNDENSESDLYSFSDSESHSNSSATFSPSDSSAASLSPPSVSPKAKSAAHVTLWFDSWVEILRSKVDNTTNLIWSKLATISRALMALRPVTVAGMLLVFLYFRQRRLMAQENSTNQLIRIMKERDERINQLLDQIARMNQALLALHGVPSSSST